MNKTLICDKCIDTNPHSTLPVQC